MSIDRYVNKILYRVAYVIVIFISMISFYLWNFPHLGSTLKTYGICLYNHSINQGYVVNQDICWRSSVSAPVPVLLQQQLSTPRLICTEEQVARISSNNEIILPLVGVVCGQLMTCCHRCINSITKYVSTTSTAIEYKTGGIQHICMYMMMIILTLIQVCSVIFIRFDFVARTSLVWRAHHTTGSTGYAQYLSCSS